MVHLFGDRALTDDRVLFTFTTLTRAHAPNSNPLHELVAQNIDMRLRHKQAYAHAQTFSSRAHVRNYRHFLAHARMRTRGNTQNVNHSRAQALEDKYERAEAFVALGRLACAVKEVRSAC